MPLVTNEQRKILKKLKQFCHTNNISITPASQLGEIDITFGHLTNRVTTLGIGADGVKVIIKQQEKEPIKTL